MDKHINLLTKLLIWKWNREQGYNDWNNIGKSRKQNRLKYNIYDYLKYDKIRKWKRT